MDPLLIAIGSGVLAGGLYAVTRYWNNRTKAIKDGKPDEATFEPLKFGKTLVIGGIIGGIAGYLGLSIEIAYANEMIYFAGVVIVEEGIKFVKGLIHKR